MANREALRELQARLADKLQAAKTQARAASWLAVESAGHGLLLPLRDAGEIFPLVPLVRVPHTAPWFLGVANLRGGVYGVVDLSAFLSGAAPMAAVESGRDQARLIAFNPAFGVNCALLADRLLGLRSIEQLQPDVAASPSGERPAFIGDRYLDEQGRYWQELRLSGLAADDAFLKITT